MNGRRRWGVHRPGQLPVTARTGAIGRDVAYHPHLCLPTIYGLRQPFYYCYVEPIDTLRGFSCTGNAHSSIPVRITRKIRRHAPLTAVDVMDIPRRILSKFSLRVPSPPPLNSTVIHMQESPPHKRFFAFFTGGHSNQDPSCTQKPIYTPIFTHQMGS